MATRLERLPLLYVFIGVLAVSLLPYVVAQETVSVQCETTKGEFTLQLVRQWAPRGVQRFLDLLNAGYWNHVAFFRVVPKFLTQFGVNVAPDQAHWRDTPIPDDPNMHISFEEGTLSFAGSGPNSRTTQLFIAYGPVPSLGKEPWETPLGRVVDGMDVVKRLYSYGDIPPWGAGPDQGRIIAEGDAYLRANFPNLDYITRCVVKDAVGQAPGGAVVQATPAAAPTWATLQNMRILQGVAIVLLAWFSVGCFFVFFGCSSGERDASRSKEI